MALSKEDKDALNEYFHNRDAYDPSKDPEQEPHDYQPKMCEGGPVGYDAGGEVPDLGNLWDTGGGSDFEDPQPADTTTVRTPLQQAPPEAPIAPKMPVPALQPISRPIPAPSMAQEPVSAPPAVSAQHRGSSLAPDQFQELVQTLSKRPSIGQSAMSGLAGLADAIETGVARAPSPGFQKNIEESRQNQRADLINALRAKYETQFKGQELGQAGQRISEEARHNKAEELETARGRQIQGDALKRQQQQLESEENKTAIEQEQKAGSLWNKLKNTVNAGIPGANPAILARATGKGQPHPQDSQAVSWAQAHPTDPRAIKILKLNGQ